MAKVTTAMQVAAPARNASAKARRKSMGEGNGNMGTSFKDESGPDTPQLGGLKSREAAGMPSSIQ